MSAMPVDAQSVRVRVDAANTNISNTTNTQEGINNNGIGTSTQSTLVTLSDFTEVADAVGRYRDYTIYFSLACPVLLFDSDVLDLLKVCTEHTLVVHVYRDFCMSIHPVRFFK